MLGEVDDPTRFGLALNADRAETRIAARMVHAHAMQHSPDEAFWAAVTETPAEAERLEAARQTADQVAEIIAGYRGTAPTGG